MSSNDVACDCLDCPYWSEYTIYPARRQIAELAVHLCYDHRSIAVMTRMARQELHESATLVVRKSLGGR